MKNICLKLNLKKMKKSRRQVFDEFRDAGVGVQIHYIPIHLLSFYRNNLIMQPVTTNMRY